MLHKSKKSLSAALILPLLFLLTFLFSTSTPGQNKAVSLTPEQSKAVSTLSNYLTKQVDVADKLLSKYDYKPPVATDIWRQYPAIKKIETAYLAAEAAEPNAGGSKLLALLSRDLAQQYEPIHTEPSLRQYLDLEASPADIRFASPKTTASPIKMKPELRQAIGKIADYCGRGGQLGSPQLVLQEYFGLKEELAYQVLNESATHTEAFQRALSHVSSQQRDVTIRRLAENVAAQYEAAKYEVSLKPYLLEGEIKSRITQLSNSNESVRVSAADWLSRNGTKLYQTEVEHVSDIMHNGSKSWEKVVSRDACGCYTKETTTVKYYAANALVNMNSPYVSQAITEKARLVQMGGKTTKFVNV